MKNLLKISILIFISAIGANLFANHPPKPHPNYAIVFPQNKVNTLEISLTKAQWDSIKADMKTKFGNDFGEGGFPNRGKMPPMPPPNFEDGPPMMNFGKGEPDYVQASIRFKGKTYPKVAFRLKGNSSLMMTWGKGVYKLPFRLDFGKFEKDKKKRKLYGFQELAFSPAMSDKSLIREKVAADIFREAGIPAAQTAFYKIYIDFGQGKKYCGVYTLTEVIDDTMIKSQFGEDSGNIYKPESNFTKFKKEQFDKKNNKKKADWSDVEAFVKTLNSTERTTNAAQWRADLEKTFNIEHFLKYLAVNTTIVNWDSYGAMAHNFYLYNSPTQKLTWIPWDHDQALGLKMEAPEGMRPPNSLQSKNSKMPDGFGFGPPPMGGGPMGRSISLSLKEASKNWPLIRFIADDEVYFAKYKNYVKEFTENVFTPEKMSALFDKNHQLIASAVAKEQKPFSHLNKLEDFDNELNSLKAHVVKRNAEVKEFLK
ncbi:hypothetical protein GCM10011514_09170 [Emticicia aquatilis]|uniref:Spore coat protein CotH n=1 Tax=Emticicia aquatilis TaxID=1537369 RepID=A0A916YIK5_9BACT|nr:CotH kinase family protein [Emticicia aquatilis]GGD47347.1 hypothetical protein GCM10011514_09170 [Emticicia aquatilis]